MFEQTREGPHARQHFRGFVELLPAHREMQIEASLAGRWLTIAPEPRGRLWDLTLSDGTHEAALHRFWSGKAVRAVDAEVDPHAHPACARATKTIPVDPSTTIVDLARH